MSDTEIYKNLRISGSKRIEFIRSLSGKDLDRAYEINKEMFQAAMDGLIGDVDKKYRYGEDNQIPSNDVPVAEFMHRMNDMNLDFVVSDTPKTEEKKSSAVVEVYPQTEEAEYHLEPAKVSSIDTPQMEDSKMKDDGVLFRITDVTPSDDALNKLRNDAKMIGVNAGLKPMPKIGIEIK